MAPEEMYVDIIGPVIGYPLQGRWLPAQRDKGHPYPVAKQDGHGDEKQCFRFGMQE